MVNGFVSLGALFWFLYLLTSPCVTSSHEIYLIFFFFYLFHDCIEFFFSWSTLAVSLFAHISACLAM